MKGVWSSRFRVGIRVVDVRNGEFHNAGDDGNGGLACEVGIGR